MKMQSLDELRRKKWEAMQKPIGRPKPAAAPTPVKNDDHAKRHAYAEAMAQKADPHYEMSDRPTSTRGHKVYEEHYRNYKG